jgi:aryl-alcohol dehydrogenase-like predicted oxidoreductase
MELRNLGRSGLRVSVVGIGCNNFGTRSDFEASRGVVHKALDLGINLFDTSDSYGLGSSEEVLGKALGPRRKDAIIATKFCSPMDKEGKLKGASRGYIMNAVEASLKRLGTDYIDLYQQHRLDPLTPIEETLRALDDLVQQGKVRYLGNSNFGAWHAVEAEWTSRQIGLEKFVCCQNEYSLLDRAVENELIPAVQAYGLGLLPYFPLASSMLTGKYKRDTKPAAETRFGKVPRLAETYMTDANWTIVERLERFCAERGHTILELAFSWLAARPTVASVIAGASAAAQVEQNVKAIGWALSADDIAKVDEMTRK